MELFKYRAKLGIPYERQGYIYFLSRNYKKLPKAKQAELERYCQRIGREYAGALWEYMTTKAAAVRICDKYYLSISTLNRIVKRYYREFPESF